MNCEFEFRITPSFFTFLFLSNFTFLDLSFCFSLRFLIYPFFHLNFSSFLLLFLFTFAYFFFHLSWVCSFTFILVHFYLRFSLRIIISLSISFKFVHFSIRPSLCSLKTINFRFGDDPIRPRTVLNLQFLQKQTLPLRNFILVNSLMNLITFLYQQSIRKTYLVKGRVICFNRTICFQ